VRSPHRPDGPGTTRGGGLRPALALALLALLTLAAPSLAAQAGQVTGRVLDAATGRPVASARVAVQGLQLAANAGVDGRYTITGVPAGPRALTVSALGYATKTVTGVQVPAGGTATQDLSLSAATVVLAELTVTAESEAGSVNQALDEQRTAVGVVNSITSEQMARSPDTDAAAAVQRVSGVSVQDGRYVVVRGLSERYTSVTLNGARIPSPEPERRVVPLDLFPSGLLQSITTAKTFTPDLSGDFGGALVNIRTREFPAGTRATFSVSTGLNTRATARDVYAAPGVGGETFAYVRDGREVPRIATLMGDFSQRQPSRDEQNRIINGFRNVWTPRQESGIPNLSAGGSVGGTRTLLGRDVGFLLSGTYSNSQEVRDDEVRGTAIAGSAGAEAEERARFEGSTGRRSVLWGGLANLSVPFGGSRISLDNSYNRSADNEARRDQGFITDYGTSTFIVDRLRYVERSVRSSQLRGEHELGARHRLEWSATSSGVARLEPDRSETVYEISTDPSTGAAMAPAWLGGSNDAAVRTFGDLREDSWEGAANYELRLGGGAREHLVRVGVLGRWTERDADNLSFSIGSSVLTRGEREARPEDLFGGAYTGSGEATLSVAPLGVGGSYTAEDRLMAGFAMAEVALSPRMRLIGGARVERSELTVDALPTFGERTVSTPEYTDVLPSLALNVALGERQNLRLSASQTLARPEYREVAPIVFRDVIGTEAVRGNPDLRRALIQNYDARWEWYPRGGEVLSLGVFAKRFKDPIERVFLATSGTPLVTFVNARSALSYGLEAEVRRDLDGVAEWLRPVTVFGNLTLVHSEIEIGDSLSSRINDQRAMVGQSPYVVNLGVTYALVDRGMSGTLLFNRFGERIVSAAEAPLPDVYERPRSSLDLSLRLPLMRGTGLRLDARNLLDSPFEIRQGSVLREGYRAGTVFTVGLNWGT
jgi:outer membrane receptor protein involved in Fe transport